VALRVPKLWNLRTDPYERADITSNTYYDWMINHIYLFVPAQQIVGGIPPDFRRLPTPSEGGELLD
jgi:hypothetical protein